MNATAEEWRPIPGIPGYEVSDLGHVRSWKQHGNPRPTKVRQPVTHCPSGHPYDATNTAYRQRGERYCRECNRVRARHHYHATKASATVIP